MICSWGIRIKRRISDMGMTITEKILAKAAGEKCVHPGQLIMADLSMVLGNDIN